MWTEWKCTDWDCCQYIRKNGNTFEMIQAISADDICEADKSEYIVVRTMIDLNDYLEEEKSEYVSMYYSDEEAEKLDEDLIAECILEQEIISGDNAVFCGKFGDVLNFIGNVIRGNLK